MPADAKTQSPTGFPITYAGRIVTDEIIGPVLLQAKPSELIARQVTSPLNITPIRTDLAEVATVALQRARTIIGE